MAHTHDHEMVSIYPFTDDEVDELLTNANECVLMWGTKDGWPVGVNGLRIAKPVFGSIDEKKAKSEEQGSVRGSESSTDFSLKYPFTWL